jgi:hypothetical protein
MSARAGRVTSKGGRYARSVSPSGERRFSSPKDASRGRQRSHSVSRSLSPMSKRYLEAALTQVSARLLLAASAASAANFFVI